MKYIGNKTRLLDFIKESLDDFGVDYDSKKVLDLFAGTGAVSRFFKTNNCNVTSVDFMNFSVSNIYYFNHFSSEPVFYELKEKIGVESLNDVFNKLLTTENKKSDYYFQNYAPDGLANRQYFTNENAKLIDNFFNNFDEIKHLLPKEKAMFLIGAAINAFDRVSNTAGTYGAYLKIWRSMALKSIELVHVDYCALGSNNIVKSDVIDFLSKNEKFDIVYMDPPYNERQYAPNFHVLENFACNDRPLLKGKTGIRNYDKQNSKFCVRSEALFEFKRLVYLLNCKTFVLSYSTEGIMDISSIKEILENKFKKVKIYQQKYRRFKTNSWTKSNTGLKELVFVCSNKK